MNKDIPKGATMIEIMQIGQLKPTLDGGKPISSLQDLHDAMKEDISRGGNATGNDFLNTQFRYDGVDNPNHKKEV